MQMRVGLDLSEFGWAHQERSDSRSTQKPLSMTIRKGLQQRPFACTDGVLQATCPRSSIRIQNNICSKWGKIIIPKSLSKPFFDRAGSALRVPIQGVLKRYPEISDRPEKVLSNPPEGSIETSTVSIYPPPPNPKGSIEPIWPPRRFNRNPSEGSLEPRSAFYPAFRIKLPLVNLPFKTFPS